MTRLIYQGADSNALNTAITPGFASRNSAPLYRVTRNMLGPQMSTQRMTPATVASASAEFENWFYFQDWAAGGYNRIELRLNDLLYGGVEANAGSSLPLTKYSIRLYFKMTALPDALSQVAPNIFQILNGTTYTWSYHLSQYQFVDALIRSHKPGIYNGNGAGASPGGLVATSGNAPLFGSQALQNTYSCQLTAWRLEVQVDAARNPKVVARIYPVDSTVVNDKLSIQGNPTDVSFERMYIGDSDASGYTKEFYLSHLEVHDDYNLGGQYSHSSNTGTTPASRLATGTPWRRPKYEVFRLDRENELLEPVEYLGTLNRGTSTIDAGVINFNDMDYRYEKPVTYERAHWFLGEAEVDGNPFEYSPGNASTDSGIIWPDPVDNPMPTNGYPLVMWAHSGFFVSGSYRDLDLGWLFHWLNRGYAVCTVGYMKSAIDLVSPYDGGQGLYPSWILDYKFCAQYLATKGMQGDETYPIDTTKMIFTGYSAGGYIALGAMASRELSNDGSGRDLRARTSTRYSWSTTYGSVPDPVPLACIVYGAPTDMLIAVENDPTDPAIGVGGDWLSIMKTTAKAFSGNAQDVVYSNSMLTNTSIPNMISRNAAALKPTMYIQGGSDYLVVPQHEEALAAAFDTYAPTVLYRKKVADGVVHDRLADQFNFNHVDAFLRDVPGL